MTNHQRWVKRKGLKSASASAKVALRLPTDGGVHRMLRRRDFARRMGSGAPVFEAAVMEYATAEVAEVLGSVTVGGEPGERAGETRARRVLLSVRSGAPLNHLVKDVCLPAGGELSERHHVRLGRQLDRIGQYLDEGSSERVEAYVPRNVNRRVEVGSRVVVRAYKRRLKGDAPGARLRVVKVLPPR